ncbi:SNARE-binding exocyst subunit S6 [Malassezia cuniculi]|uniref:SNARE-binding exocyst subunit S6 n=1 Tax=Malassezia cuniculi TaxID=948313 RepID=A0AAF0ERI9_9BASI|nr:SNARE-binding exocyst subunit S6 [Malassezia cuniculi]
MAAWNAPNAVGLVAEYLKSPDDLSKIVTLRRKLTREHAALSAKLRIGAKDHIESLRRGLMQLQTSRDDITGIHELFAQIDTMFADPMNDQTPGAAQETKGTKSFRIISEMSHIHRCLVQTSGMLAKFESLSQEVQNIAIVLQQHASQLLGPAPQLLELHYKISEWETFRNETLHAAASTGATSQGELNQLFLPLDELINAFEDYFFSLAANVLQLVRAQQSSVVVRLVKIMERENRADEKTAAIRLAKRANLEGAARFRSVAAYGHTIKLYRLKFQETVQLTVQERLSAAWMTYTRNERDATVVGFCSQLDWFFDDLDVVRVSLVPLFPADYNIHRTYVQAYHRALSALVQEKGMHDDAGASSLLELYRYSQQYRARLLHERSEIDPAWLEPALLGERESSVIGDYVGLIISKIDEWTATLMHGEVTAFITREKAPEENGNGMYHLSAAVILFRMVNQQIDISREAEDPEVVLKVVEHACMVLRNCQATWLQIVQQEFKKQTEAKKPEDVTGGLVEYLIALANDQLASADHSQELLQRVEQFIPSQWKGRFRETVDNMLNGFLDVSKHCTQLLVELVLFDLYPAFKDLFTFPAWYVEGTTATIIETVRDYADDYAARLDPNLFDVLSDDLMTRLITSYLVTLRRAARLRMPKAADRFKADVSELTGLFMSIRPAAEVEQRVEVLHMIHAILSSSPTMVFLPYWTFAKAHGPNLQYLDALLRARDDIERADAASIMESAKRKVKQENMAEVPESGATIMQAVAQAQSSSFFGALTGWTSAQNFLSSAAESRSTPWSSLAQSAQSYLGAGWRRESNA